MAGEREEEKTPICTLAEMRFLNFSQAVLHDISLTIRGRDMQHSIGRVLSVKVRNGWYIKASRLAVAYQSLQNGDINFEAGEYSSWQEVLLFSHIISEVS